MKIQPAHFVDSESGLTLAQLEKLRASWLTDGEIGNRSPKTLKTRRDILDKLVWLLKHRGSDTCGVDELRAFFLYLRNGHTEPGGRWGNPTETAPLRPLTHRTYHAYLRAFFNCCAAEGRLSSSPMDRIVVTRDPGDEVQPFSDEDIEALLRAAGKTRQAARDVAITLVLPDTIVAQNGPPTVTESARLPFRSFGPGAGQGIATGYLAYDDRYFYFAAKVADSTPDGGTLRFVTRDDDQFFYPEVSYVKRLHDPQTAPVAESDTDTPKPLVWPKGVRRYSYRKDPILPAGSFPDLDNVQIAFNILPQSRKRFAASTPGTPPDHTIAQDTDSEYALNRVAEKYGGGTEVWRLNAPGMPLKHFYPRQPKSPLDGPVAGAKLAVVQTPTTRVVEAAIPWPEIPEVAACMRARRPIKFSFRVNDDAGVGCMELARGRSVAKRGASFHVDWIEHWENQVEFGWGASARVSRRATERTAQFHDTYDRSDPHGCCRGRRGCSGSSGAEGPHAGAPEGEREPALSCP